MKLIDEQQLENDVIYRFNYLTEFIGFDEEDRQALQSVADQLLPIVPELVDATYEKLFSFNCTRRHFVPRQFGYEGMELEHLEYLTEESPTIKLRKSHLNLYLTALIKGPYNDKMVAYLDRVGQVHTPEAGIKHMKIPLVHMNATLGFLSNAFIHAIVALRLEHQQESAPLSAFNKLFWLQNDLISRHYQRDFDSHIHPHGLDSKDSHE